MRNSINRIRTLTGRNIKEIIRDPLSVIFMVMVPLLLEVLFYFAFHKLTSQFEMKNLAPGIVVFSQSFLTLFTGLLIAADRGTSFLTRLYVSESKSFEFIFSYALAVLPLTLAQAILFFAVGVIIEPSIFCAGMIWAILLSLVTSLFFIAFGLLFGCLCNEKSIGGIASIIICGQSVLSGMWFPIEGMGKGIITLMNVLPFRNASTVIKNALNGINDPFRDFILPLIIVLAYTAIAFVLAIVIFNRKMKAQ